MKFNPDSVTAIHSFLKSMAISWMPVVVAILVACVVHSGAVQAAQDDKIKESEKCVVKIEVTEGNGSDLIGSGFVAESTGVIVTNVRVLAGAKRARVTFPSGKTYDIEGTYYIDQGLDICIAQLDTDDVFDYLELTSFDPRAGASVIALGAPSGQAFETAKGIVSAIRDGAEVAKKIPRDTVRNRSNKPLSGTWVEVEADLPQGYRGGPMVNPRGEVVAMSALASKGEAKDLNYGISAGDISRALRTSNMSEVISLERGVGTIRGALPRIDGTDGNAANLALAIPQKALRDYTHRCKEDWPDLCKRVRKLRSRQNSEWLAMKKGREYPHQNQRGQRWYRILGKNGTITYYFLTARVKELEIDKQGAKLKAIQANLEKLTDVPTDESLLALMKVVGPLLVPQDHETIGFMRGAFVGKSLNDHEVIAYWDGVPYLLWVKSTAGMFEDEPIKPRAVFVVGTKKMSVPGMSNRLMTVLKSVEDDEFKQAVLNPEDDSPISEDLMAKYEMRTWTSARGKHKTKARFVSSDGKLIKLRDEKDNLITLKLDQLSGPDTEYIKNIRKARLNKKNQ